MTPFDIPHTTFYEFSIVSIYLSCNSIELFEVKEHHCLEVVMLESLTL